MAAPVQFSGKLLTYVDLALDLYVSRHGEITVLDEEEFEHLAATQLPGDILAAARDSWSELLSALERKEGYFKILAE
jgi:protein associated with RNAse G/E